MTLIKLKDSGFHDSAEKIGSWNIPQSEGDDRPRGNRTYDSFKFSKSFSSIGTRKEENGLRIISDGAKLSAGSAIMKGHLITLEDDVDIPASTTAIYMGINRNPDERYTYIGFGESGYTPTQETLSQSGGIWEEIIYEKIGDEFEYKLINEESIKKYQEMWITNKNGETIYDVEIIKIPQNLLEKPEDYNWQNISFNAICNKRYDSGKHKLRIRKGSAFVDIYFDSDYPYIGVNEIFIYKNSEGELKATVGGSK